MQRMQKIEHKTSTEETPLVEVTKFFRVPPAEVFRAWSDVAQIHQWWGPQGMMCPYARADFKQKGTYLFAMRDVEDKTKIIWCTGHYEQIIPDKKIVFSDIPSDRQGHELSPKEAGMEGPWADYGVGFVTVEFEPNDEGGTTLRLSHEGLPAKMHDKCVEGWSSSLDKMKALLEKH